MWHAAHGHWCGITAAGMRDLTVHQHVEMERWIHEQAG